MLFKWLSGMSLWMQVPTVRRVALTTPCFYLFLISVKCIRNIYIYIYMSLKPINYFNWKYKTVDDKLSYDSIRKYSRREQLQTQNHILNLW